MNEVVEVKLWGTTIGHLGYAPGQFRAATFEYSEKLLNTSIQISPLKLPNTQSLYSFPDISERTFKGLPGVFADSLPDKFGNQLIDIYMAEKNIPAEEITALDRLLYIGTRGMGAIEYHPAEKLKGKDTENLVLDIHTLSELASLAASNDTVLRQKLMNSETRSQALKLIRVGSSAGGARSKALIAISPDGLIMDGTVNHGIHHSYWLMKFDNENNRDRDNSDPKGMPKVEYIYSLIAGECGINIPRTDFIEDGNDFHFLIERFDRVVIQEKLEKRHYASWSGLAHAHRDATGAYAYEQLILLSRQLGLGQQAVTELFKRSIFNIVGRNQDDHTKNFGFLMDKAGTWSLAPAFDLTYAYDYAGRWTRNHQIKINGKQTNFTMNDLLQFGEYCNLNLKKASQIINDITGTFESFDSHSRALELDSRLAGTIKKNLRLSFQ